MTELVQNKEPCVDCGEIFMRIKQRGRPPTRCNDCKSLFVQQRVEANVVEVNEERLYRGNKKELLGNWNIHRPNGNEAQCPKCGRVFTSDSACESHKDYRTVEVCIDPSTLGMVALSRRDIPVWTRPSNRFKEA
jgi:hypothetical protein